MIVSFSGIGWTVSGLIAIAEAEGRLLTAFLFIISSYCCLCLYLLQAMQKKMRINMSTTTPTLPPIIAPIGTSLE
jgi:hypothetical protein